MTDTNIPKAKRSGPNGGKGRPPGHKNKQEAKRNFAVDKFRSTQPMEWVTEFDTWVAMFAPSIGDIHNRLKEAGYTFGWSSVQTWHTYNFPTGEEARRVNQLATRMSGIKPHSMMEMSLVQAASTLDNLMTRLTTASMESLPLLELVKMVGPLSKEVRTTAKQLAEYQNTASHAELQMSGAVSVIEYLLQTFEDNSAMLPPLKEACRAAIAKLQGE